MKYMFLCLAVCLSLMTSAQKTGLNIIAYYSGDEKAIDGYPVEKLSHIIYSFCHLKGNRLNVDDAKDSATIKKLVSLKQKNPKLRVMLSLGGWGGCKSCSDVFSENAARLEFAASVKELNDYFGTDGIDLDWEYPCYSEADIKSLPDDKCNFTLLLKAIRDALDVKGTPGHPGHPWKVEDKPNFTALVKALRDALGSKHEISFAAGGFRRFLEEAVEWKLLEPLIDRVNLMSYDLVSGFSTTTGHHTPLYSNANQEASADHAITWLDSIGFPMNKVVIGAAFYARTWEGVENINNGLYQSGTFKSFVARRNFVQQFTEAKGYVFYRDPVSQAPYAYSSKEKIFATYDDEISIRAKTKYARDKKLDGIMFWELTLDPKEKGLLEEMGR